MDKWEKGFQKVWNRYKNIKIEEAEARKIFMAGAQVSHDSFKEAILEEVKARMAADAYKRN
jgi:hypothetical protein